MDVVILVYLAKLIKKEKHTYDLYIFYSIEATVETLYTYNEFEINKNLIH